MTDYGQQEAIARDGADPRIFSIMTTKFVGDEQGRVEELHTTEVEWVTGSNGTRPYPQAIPGTEKVWPAQLVLLAMGFSAPKTLWSSNLVWRRTNARMLMQSTANSPPMFPVFLLLVICAVARAWWSGRSTKGGAQHERWTAI